MDSDAAIEMQYDKERVTAQELTLSPTDRQLSVPNWMQWDDVDNEMASAAEQFSTGPLHSQVRASKPESLHYSRKRFTC